jgi:Xaa-Pro aminopeptidase
MRCIAEAKLAQATQYLEKSNTDLWIIYSSEGSDPAVNLLFGMETVGRTFFLLTRQGKRYVIATVIDAQEYEDSGLFDEVIKYQGEPAMVLNKLVNRINPNQIALNYSLDDHLCDGLTVGRYRYIEKALGQPVSVPFISSEPVLSRIRAIKTPEEIAAMRRAINITEEIYEEVFAQVRAGMTEREVGQLFVEGMRRRGVYSSITRALTPPIVMKERIAHRMPGDAVLEPGDYLIVDFGVVVDGYASDIARTAYLLKEGESRAPERFEKIFGTVYDAISKAYEVVRPGVQGWEVDKAAREYILSQGMPEITHGVGHQIGTYAHDGGTLFAPKWDRYGRAPYGVIEAGMVFTLEPSIFFEDDYCVLCEEEILVTPNGAEFLTRRQEELILLPT